MDRDKRWERVARTYETLLGQTTASFASAVQGVQAHYDRGVTDEFVEPFLVDDVDGRVRPGDVVLCFNFRTDRCREITQALTQEAFPEHGMEPLDLHYVTMTNYDEGFRGVQVCTTSPT